MEKIRWGILGAGRIANTFAEGLKVLPDAELIAVGSRKLETAQEFGQKYDIAHCHGSYEALAKDSAVDAIYVATPHPWHKENCLLCIENGKAVLCEKPFTINAQEADEVIIAARKKNVLVMEAMWTRFLPLMGRVREMLAQGVIGDVRMVTADFGFRAALNPQGRLFDLELGGGALLDVGVYCVSFASMVMRGALPTQVVSQAEIGSTRIDEQSAYILKYAQGQLAILYTAVRTNTPHEGVIMGTEGRIRIHSEIFHPTRMTLTTYGKGEEVIDVPFEGNGFNYEAAEAMRCMRAGKIDSDILPTGETLAIMQTMDQIRAPWGLKYPTEM